MPVPPDAQPPHQEHLHLPGGLTSAPTPPPPSPPAPVGSTACSSSFFAWLDSVHGGRADAQCPGTPVGSGTVSLTPKYRRGPSSALGVHFMPRGPRGLTVEGGHLRWPDGTPFGENPKGQNAPWFSLRPCWGSGRRQCICSWQACLSPHRPWGLGSCSARTGRRRASGARGRCARGALTSPPPPGAVPLTALLPAPQVPG